MSLVEFYFDVGSPASYLAHKRLRAGYLKDCRVEWKPILLGGLLKASGNPSPTDVPAKRAWMKLDFQRCAARDRIPFLWNRAWPINTLFLMRAVTGMENDRRFPTLVDALFDALWANDADLGNPLVRTAVLEDAGFDVSQIAGLTEDAEVKARLKGRTEALAHRGAFGAPTFFVGDQMFFGQDRMTFVADAALALKR